MIVTNPIWANAQQTLINCQIEHPEYGLIPFTASADDPEQHGKDIHAAILAGEHGAIGVYVPPPAETPEQMWLRIKAERDRRSEAGGFPVQIEGETKWFHSDVKSRTQQLGMVIMGATLPTGIDWKTMDGSFVAMTPALAQAIFAAGAAQEQAVFAAAQTHRVAMESSAEPSAYDFSGGWPATYQDSELT
jgi:Domain of unknown function (DUF4376)